MATSAAEKANLVNVDIRMDGKIAMRIRTDKHGAAALTSTIGRTRREAREFTADAAREIEDVLVEHIGSRIPAKTRSAIAKQLAKVTNDPIESAIDGIESFVLALVAAGVDVSQPTFSKALQTSLEAILCWM
jgi:hypothetical protein